MGTVSVHSFNEMSSDEGSPKMGTGYNEKLVPVKPIPGDDSDGSENEDDSEDEPDHRVRRIAWLRAGRYR
jgi:DDB1- and CUL4-associated factor 11